MMLIIVFYVNDSIIINFKLKKYQCDSFFLYHHSNLPIEPVSHGGCMHFCWTLLSLTVLIAPLHGSVDLHRSSD